MQLISVRLFFFFLRFFLRFSQVLIFLLTVMENKEEFTCDVRVTIVHDAAIAIFRSPFEDEAARK